MTPSPQTCDEALAELFAVLGRSLLQYADEAELWSADEGAQGTLDRLAAGQRESFAEVSDLIVSRHVLPELGTHPPEFASLHYLALDFVIGRLVADQLAVVTTIDATIAVCGRGPGGRRLERVRAREAGHVDELTRLADRLRPRAGKEA